MKTKSFKILIAVLAVLLVVALTFGITGAFYTDKRQANGALQFSNGVTIKYKLAGDQTAGAEWTKDRATVKINNVDTQVGGTLELFSLTSVLPGASQSFPSSFSLLGKYGSSNFYARVRLDYKFSGYTLTLNAQGKETARTANSNIVVPTNQYDEIFTTTETTGSNPTGLFSDSWKKNTTQGWYYYVGTGSSITTFTKENSVTANTTSYVNVFANNAKLNMAIFDYPGNSSNIPNSSETASGGGYKVVVSGTTYIVDQVTVTFVLDILQEGANLSNAGWKLTGA